MEYKSPAFQLTYCLNNSTENYATCDLCLFQDIHFMLPLCEL